MKNVKHVNVKSAKRKNAKHVKLSKMQNEKM